MLKMNWTLPVFGLALAFALVPRTTGAQQEPDADFNTAITHPAWTESHPRVLFDEAHNNFHKASGRYKPFADLMTHDGFEIVPGPEAFRRESLDGYDILVISNARPNNRPVGLHVDPAFRPEECDAVREWVRGGGGLLLIADHWPMNAAAAAMAERFGVESGRLGFVSDSLHAEPGSGDPSQLVFTRENGLLGKHPITEGRNPEERIDRVVSFTGQSLRGPKGSTAFLGLSPSAVDETAPDIMGDAIAEIPPAERRVSAAGRAQGLAFTYGKGRVVVLGEAAMMTAQRHGEERFGMNSPGNQNRQLALNIMHWLSGILPE